jgi:hypothetical protein
VGFPEEAVRLSPLAFQSSRRQCIATLRPGGRVWATGVLSRSASERGGAYRGGAQRRTLRAPRGGAIELSVEPPVARWRRRAEWHRKGAFAALLALGLVHAVFWRTLDFAVVTGTLADLPRSFAAWADIPPVLLMPGWLSLIVVISLWRKGLRKA